jgi:multidrug efflux system outer membrane protein
MFGPNASAATSHPSEPANVHKLGGGIRSVLISILLVASTVTNVVAQKNLEPARVNTPGSFRGSDVSATSNQTSIGDLKWFEVFKDPDLQQLIRRAMIENYDLRAAVVRIDAARANVGLARSEQLPQFDASTDLTTVRTSRNGQLIPSGQGGKNRSFGSVFLNLLTFELDVWGRLRQQTKAARAELRTSEADRRAVQTTVVSDVASGYFSLLELDSELEIAKRTLTSRAESLALIRTREQNGVATVLEVREAEQLVYQASATIPDTQRLIERTENQINFLLGANPRSIARGRLAQQQELPTVPPGLPSSLLERRPDVRAAEENLVAQRALVSAARKAYFPRISLTGLLGFQSNQLSNLFTGPSGVWTFVPQITQPIFTGGRLKSNVRSARAQQALAVVQYEATIRNAFREVSDALVDYQKVKEIRAEQEQLVITLRDRSGLAYLRYQGGVDTLLNALDADRELFDAELNLAQTKRNELVSLVQLYKALGGGWQ